MGTDTAVVVAGAAAAFGALLVTARWASVRSQRRFEVVVRQLDEHMQAISHNLGRAVERSEEARTPGAGRQWVTLDLQELLRSLVEEATRLTGAHAASVTVRGTSGLPAVASYGIGEEGCLLEAALRPPDRRPLRALTVGWDYAPSIGAGSAAFRSALVVPILEDGVETGALAAYSRGTAAFGPEHAPRLEALAADAAPGIANARRFEQTELRAITDPLTGVRNRRGYEDELERELARARRTGRPVSVLLIGADVDGLRTRADRSGAELVLQELADLLEHTARTTDTVCLRAHDEFAIILAETSLEDARNLETRLRETLTAAALSNVGNVQLSFGIVEWEPSETRESLDSRAFASLSSADRSVTAGPIDSGRGERRRSSSRVEQRSNRLGSRDELLARLAVEVERAHSESLDLSLLLVDTAATSDRQPDGRVLGELAERLGESVPRGGASCRIGPSELAVILPHTSAELAASVFLDLRESLRRRRHEWANGDSISAGITELTADDDPQSVFGRAEQALWQARQAGAGTVVVATASDGRRGG